VTTVLDMGAASGRAPPLRALRGQTDLADFYSAGVAATAPGGHGTQYGYERPTISTADSADAFVAARVGEQSDYIKIIFEYGSRGQFQNMDEPTPAALVRASQRYGKLAVVHISRAVDARAAFEAGADGIVHTCWDTGAASEVARLGASRGAFAIPTITAPHLRSWLYAAVRDLHTAGVRILAGSDAPNLGTWHGVSLHRELELLVEAGLSPDWRKLLDPRRPPGGTR
jgi:hypothetical protein